MLLISAALSISVSTHLHALAPVLEEVVVTGMRQQNRLAELPYSAYTLNQEALQRSRSLPEALAGQPGVLVQKTANGHGSPFIRGFTGYRTLALIDGVRYNNSVYRDGPNEYFALIDSQSLASLELFNGPASVLYGSDAVGGTLNLRSRQSSYTEQLGSFWQLGQSLVYSSAERSVRSRTELDLGQGDSWGLLAGFSRKHFGDIKAAGLGTLPTTGYDERAHDLRVDTQLNSHWSLSALSQQLSQDDVWRSHSTIYAKPFAGSSIGGDLRRLKDQRRRLHYIKLNGQALGLIDDLQLTLSRQHWREHGQRQRANGSGLREYFDSRMDGLDLQLQSQFGQHRWLYGIDFYRDQVDSGRRDYSAAGELSQIHIQGPVGDDSRFAQLGVFSQWQLALGEQWQLWLGNRYTQVRAKVGRYRDPASGTEAALAQRWSDLANSARLQYQPQRPWQLWLGLSQAFRAPNIADLSRFGKSRSNETEVAAPNLKPEQFLTAELGWRWQSPELQAQVSAYYTGIKDYIASLPTGRLVGELIEVSKANAASGRVWGLEAQLDYQLSNHWRLGATVSWLKARQQLPGQGEQPFSRSMPLQGRLSLGYQWAKARLNLTLSHSAKAEQLSEADRQDTQRIPPGGTPAYTLLNLRGHYQLSEQIELQLALNNLGNKAYRTHGSGINGPGRGISLGVNARFN